MASTSWLQRRWKQLVATRRSKPIAPRTSFRPRLEMFEERNLLSVYMVGNLNDSGPGSLRAAIASANSHAGADSIGFAGALSGTIHLTTDELSITDSVTIAGPGSSRLAISGNDASRIFDLTAGSTVAINGLTMTHGYALDQAGGILNQGSDLSLTSDVLSSNVVAEGSSGGARGGALRSLAGNLSITNCQIVGNKALGGTGPSAGGDALGGGVYVLAGNATIVNTTISGNLSQGGDNSYYGGGFEGGLDVVSSATLSGCTIANNIAHGGLNASFNDAAGGGIGGRGDLTIVRCTITGNQAIGGSGGTGYNDGIGAGGGFNISGSVTISNSVIDHNLATGGSGSNSGSGIDDPFVDYAFGAGINSQYGAILAITNCRFSYNVALGGNNSVATGADIVGAGGAEGGAILSEVGTTTTIAASSFDHNQAIGGSGNSGSGALVLVGEGLGGAIASGYSGALYGPNAVMVTACTFTQNNAQGGNNNSGTAATGGLVGVGAGAGIANYAGGTATIDSSSLLHNTAIGGSGNSSGGGAIVTNAGIGGGAFNYLGNYSSPDADFGQLDASVLKISNSLISLNEAQGTCGEGGGIADLASATTTVSYSTLALNEADGHQGLGGGAYNDSTSSLGLTRSLVTLNLATGAHGFGGGIYNVGTLTYDAFTLILFNLASTHGNNVGP